MAGAIDDLLAGHALLSGPVEESGSVSESLSVVQSQQAGRYAQLLVRTGTKAQTPIGWESDDVSLEELVLAYLRQPSVMTLPGSLNLMAHSSTRVTR